MLNSICFRFVCISVLPERKYKVILNLLAGSFLHLVKDLASLPLFMSVKVDVSIFYLLKYYLHTVTPLSVQLYDDTAL